MNRFLKLLLGTSLYLLEQSDNATRSARDRATEQIDNYCDGQDQRAKGSAHAD